MAASEHPRPDDADVPTGLPGDGPEAEPLGVPEARPEGEGEPERGPGRDARRARRSRAARRRLTAPAAS